MSVVGVIIVIFLVFGFVMFMHSARKRLKDDEKHDDEREEQPMVTSRYEYESTVDYALKYGDFRIKIEDVFYIHGRGVVVTGRVESGEVKLGDQVILHRKDNSEILVVIKGIEQFRKHKKSAAEGENVGLLLGDINKEDVSAGDYLIMR